MSPDVAASVKARLLARAKEKQEELELFLVRYAGERFLYRLGASEVREQCVLKGAGLLATWMDDPYRATRDLDVLAYCENSAGSIRAVVETVCRVPCAEDGLRFDLDHLVITPIRAEHEHPGYRAVIEAYLGKAKVRLQVNFGFGDFIAPGPEETKYPTLLDGMPAPRLRSYPRVATIAEKFEAMIRLGRRNSRMKDFHDIWALSETFAFEGAALREAVVRCFEMRSSSWTSEVPDVLGPGFYSSLQRRCEGYLRAGGFQKPPPGDFQEIGERMRAFLRPVRDSIVDGTGFSMFWPAGGPWEPAGSTGEYEGV